MLSDDVGRIFRKVSPFPISYFPPATRASCGINLCKLSTLLPKQFYAFDTLWGDLSKCAFEYFHYILASLVEYIY